MRRNQPSIIVEIVRPVIVGIGLELYDYYFANRQSSVHRSIYFRKVKSRFRARVSVGIKSNSRLTAETSPAYDLQKKHAIALAVFPNILG
jgi:hypothetical protein